MKAHIEHAFQLDSFRVWLFDRLGPRAESGGGRLFIPGREYGQYEEVEQGDGDPKPSLVLPREALEALMATASDVLPPSAATDRHLKDAIQVRDRLLALVEKRK